MIVALTCFRKPLRNRFWQEGMLNMHCYFHVLEHFIYFNFLLSTYFPIFLMLSQVCCRKMLTFCRSQDKRMACRNHFQNHRKFSEKCSSWSLNELCFHHVCHDIFSYKEAFQKPIMPCHYYLPFFLPSLSIIHARVYYFIALYIMTSCMPTFLSRTHFSSFPVYLFPFE